MPTRFLVDGRERAFYLAFDLLLAEVPLVDGRADLRRGEMARGSSPAEEAALALVRAELLAGWPGPDREECLRRAYEKTRLAGLDAPPTVLRLDP